MLVSSDVAFKDDIGKRLDIHYPDQGRIHSTETRVLYNNTITTWDNYHYD